MRALRTFRRTPVVTAIALGSIAITVGATAVVFTASAVMRPPPRVTMVVDRPFLFAIIDTATSLPLFLGQVSHPRSG